MKKVIIALSVLPFCVHASGFTKGQQSSNALRDTTSWWTWVDTPQQMLELGDKTIVNLQELSTKAPTSYDLPIQPWSDTFWPMVNGQISWRYGEFPTPVKKTFKELYQYSHTERPIESYQGEDRNNLSPAEKYDLLLGDEKHSLSERNWIEGQLAGGLMPGITIPDWVGICHGWAVAAFMMPRPTHAVVTKDSNGEDLTFYPSDIKALGDQLWATAIPEAKFLGRRCSNDFPERDPDNLRPLDSDCNDINPGQFHISVLNQLGISHLSFVAEVDPTSEVWNQPVVGYALHYFNPETQQKSDDPSKVTIALSDYKSDIFTKYRDDKTTSIVGVEMEFKYGDEIEPSHAKINTKADDLVETVTYIYDLELDEAGNIIGGEWHNQMNHPDYIWTVKANAVAKSKIDGKGEWDINQPVPLGWKKASQEVSGYNTPLSSVVYKLFEAASAKDNLNSWKQLETNGLCLDLLNGYHFTGAYVSVDNCQNLESQQWMMTDDGHMSPKSAPTMCLTNNFITPCNKDIPEQKWSLADGHLKNAAGGILENTQKEFPATIVTSGSSSIWAWKK